MYPMVIEVLVKKSNFREKKLIKYDHQFREDIKTI